MVSELYPGAVGTVEKEMAGKKRKNNKLFTAIKIELGNNCSSWTSEKKIAYWRREINERRLKEEKERRSEGDCRLEKGTP